MEIPWFPVSTFPQISIEFCTKKGKLLGHFSSDEFFTSNRSQPAALHLPEIMAMKQGGEDKLNQGDAIRGLLSNHAG
jgi:hypothetical protein